MSQIWGSQTLGAAHSSFTGSQLSAPSCSPRVAAPARLQVSAAQIGPGKNWEHYELTKNKRVKRAPMHVKKGDTVQVIAGSDKGKVGEITDVLVKLGQVVVGGVNVKYRTKQPKAQDEKGEIIQTESPIHHSNVMLYSKEKQVRSRAGHKILENGKKVRYLIKTGEVVDK